MEKNIKNLLEKSKELIKQGHLENALKLLEDSLEKQFDPENELTLLLSRFNVVKRDVFAQLITKEEKEVKHANIIKALLVFIEGLSNELSKNPSTLEEKAIALEPPIFEGKKQVLLLYASEDQEWLEKINKHLFMLKRHPELHFVDIHNDIPLASLDKNVYQEKLVEVADSVLCLLTPNCLSYSIFPLIEKAAESQKLIPIKVELMDTKDTILDLIQGLPSNQKFVSQWSDENTAFVDIVKGLKKFFVSK